MAKVNKTDAVAVGFCLDESFSMWDCFQPTLKGFNRYISKLGKQKGKTTVTLTKFSSPLDEERYRIAFEARSIGKVPKLSEENYRPRGNTPLFDAIGATISKLDVELKAYGKNPPAAVVVIQTDGQENDSSEYKREQILRLIEKREEAGWTFVFLGANMDDAQAARVAASVGVKGSMGYEGARSDQAFVAVASATGGVRDHRRSGLVTSSLDAASLTRSAYEKLKGENGDDLEAGNGDDLDAVGNHWSSRSK